MEEGNLIDLLRKCDPENDGKTIYLDDRLSKRRHR